MAKETKAKKSASPKGNAKTDPRSATRLNFEAVLMAVMLTLFCRAFVAEPFKIPTGSMEPTLLIGDHLIVNKMLYAPVGPLDKTLPEMFRDVERGDIVVFVSSVEPGKKLIKRVIGLPNERLRIESKRVFINGEALDEPYASFLFPMDGGGRPGDDLPELRIPDGHLFVMGDNRDNSYDSRFWGTLPLNQVRGKALLVYWSFDASTEAYLAEGWGRLRELAKTAWYFIPRTRWERTFLPAK